MSQLPVDLKSHYTLIITHYNLNDTPISAITVLRLTMCVCYRLSHVWLCPPGSSVHGILQARILKWIAIPFSRVSSWPRDRTRISHIEGRFFTIWATRRTWKWLIMKMSLQDVKEIRFSSYTLIPCFFSSLVIGGSADKEFVCNAGDLSLIPLLGRSSGQGNGYPLHYSGLENSMGCIV